MTERKRRSGPATDLRRRAEEKARAIEEKTLGTVPPEEARQLLHELRVHQIELEMQNEELRRTQAELEASRRGISTSTTWPRSAMSPSAKRG